MALPLAPSGPPRGNSPTNMQRRKFIATVAALPALSACATVPGDDADIAIDVADIGPALRARLAAVLAWIASTPWQSYLTTTLAVSLPPSSDSNAGSVLTREMTPEALSLIRCRPGFEDFGGKRLLEPGKPALSLLYFALASPRVRLPDGAVAEHYPDVAQLDALEDVIYAMQGVSHLLDQDDHVLAVFAYEFRPAARTPHGHHADMVFSRTGISRVGTRPQRWNRTRRCFDNVPEDMPGQSLEPQDVAATPARFGLFLAKVVRRSGLRLQKSERLDFFKRFLLPVRKLVDGDPLLAGANITFGQYHRDEKLHRLTTMKGTHWERIRLPAGVPFDCLAPPFLRVTSTSTANPSAALAGDNTSGTEQQLVALTALGSSVLLGACPSPLVREAVQQVAGRHERLRFKVPEYKTFGNDGLSNRRYTTLKLIEDPQREAAAFGMDDIVLGGGRPTTTFIAPRNGPTFVNIRYLVQEHDGSTPIHLGPGCGYADWEDLIRRGGYWAAMFQDNLCDGCVSADLTPGVDAMASTPFLRRLASLERLPAFSLVAAPDFMQLVDGNDLHDYDEHFLEGGTEPVSGARVRANPHLKLPGTDRQAFVAPVALSFHEDATNRLAQRTALTVTAVVSGSAVRERAKVFALDYEATNSLPDTASNVFAPGWDVTYSTIGQQGTESFYFASFGLGSPFPEDMKLCAAANGMWPASSPDSSRTFYPSLGKVITSVVRYKRRSVRPPTAVPLLDTEIGYHPACPAVLAGQVQPGVGWDGEYGPFLTRREGLPGTPGRLAVNFTEIGRADYVQNALSNDRQMHMRALQGLTPEEIIARMGALRTCVRRLPDEPAKVRLSTLWLISAEAVADWSAGAPGNGIPDNITADGKRWALGSRLGPGVHDGYLFVFANGVDDQFQACATDPTRASVACESVYLCQLARKSGPDDWALAWVALPGTATRAPAAAEWHVLT